MFPRWDPSWGPARGGQDPEGTLGTFLDPQGEQGDGDRGAEGKRGSRGTVWTMWIVGTVRPGALEARHSGGWGVPGDRVVSHNELTLLARQALHLRSGKNSAWT